MHAQAGRTREAQRIRAVVTQQLAPFTATMPTPVLVGIGGTPASGAGTRPTAADIGRRGMAPVRPGSVVPSTPEKAKTHQRNGPDTEPVLDR
jgi:hypothetical protein